MRDRARRRARRARAAAAAGARVGRPRRRRATAAPSAAASCTPIRAAELPLVAQVLGATLVLRTHGRHARRCRPATFFAGPMTTALRPDECLEEIHWPVWRERRTGSAFTEISRRHGDFAMVAAAAQVALDDDGRCTRASLRPRRRGADAARVSRARAAAGRHAAGRGDAAQSVAHDAAAAARTRQRPARERRLPAASRRRARGARAAIAPATHARAVP